MRQEKENTRRHPARAPSGSGRFDVDDELFKRLIINLGRSIGASRLATQALLQGAMYDPKLGRELLQGIDQQLRNSSLVLDNLVQFRVLQRNALQLDLKPIDLQQWLPTLLAKWRPWAEQRGLAWREELYPRSLPVRVDSERLSQATANLLSNALEHTPSRGAVTVTTGAAKTEAWIRIVNTGPGLTADERERVFEPFFASANQGRFPRGVGLGLAVAHGLVAAHQGHLEVESAAGQGCTFCIRLPLARPNGFSAGDPPGDIE